MSSLKNYFGKKVDGLFVRITAASDAGVSMVEGEGYYCYGTYVTLKAILRTGYEFEQWSGKTRSTQASISFYATEAGKWIASTTRKKLTLVFHRNLSADDTRYDTQPLAYGDGGTPLQRITWTKNGQELIGWALSADSTTVVYPAKYSVTNELILKSASTLELYAVYGQSVVSVPDTSAIPTSPVTPTTTTPTPGTQTVTSKPDTEILPSNPQPSEDETGTGTEPIRVRFISSKYFEDVSQNLIPQAQGGLAADSKWAVDPALRTLLRRVLSRT
jgi:hypothetical protein